MFRASLCPKHVEIILIKNKSPFVASSWSHTYLLIKMHGHSNIKFSEPIILCIFGSLIFFRNFFLCPILPETTLSDIKRQTFKGEKMAVVYTVSAGTTQTFYSSEFDAC